MIEGCTRWANGLCAKPQSVPPMHVLAADDLGEPHQPLRHQLGMLDDVGGVADDAGDELLAGRQLRGLPHRPFVLVARVGLLDAVGADVHLQQ